METVLFTDHGVVIFAITTSAFALIFSVLGLATTRQTRCDIERELKGCGECRAANQYVWQAYC